MWRKLSGNARFSIAAFVLTLALGLLSMGAYGYGLYFLVAPFLNKNIDTLRGDITWPTVLWVGIFSSLGFLIAGAVFHYLRSRVGEIISYVIYAGVLWCWVWIVWYLFLNFPIA